MAVGTDEVGADLRGALKLALAATFLVGTACARTTAPAKAESTTLRIGFGSTQGQNTETGLRQQLSLMEREGLLSLARDGQPQAWLADHWTSAPDGLTWRLQLRSNVKFHNGKPLTADTLARFLSDQLPRYMGPLWEDVSAIRAVSEHELEFALKSRSRFLMESLDIPIEEPESHSATGAFQVTSAGDSFELRANKDYYDGTALVDRIVVKTYASTRAAWADLLRGEVDMLYEVGIDALDSLQPSNDVKIFTQQRSYAYLLLLNVHKKDLTESTIRRQLNEAIDRDSLIAEALRGHGRPADGPVWPSNWAYDAQLPKFVYRPVPLKSPFVLTCLFDASLERLAITTQKQLAAIGVELKLELMPLDKIVERVQTGDFEAILADANGGPTMFRAYRFWHSGAPLNWGKYSNPKVDNALDSIRHAADDDAYRAGVAAFQRAIVDDPPAIFLAWSERARAVSTRFDVPVEPGRDILSTLRLWRPVGEPRAAHN